MKDIKKKIGLSPNILLFFYISIENTILDGMFPMTKREAMSPKVTG